MLIVAVEKENNMQLINSYELEERNLSVQYRSYVATSFTCSVFVPFLCAQLGMSPSLCISQIFFLPK